MCLNASVIKGKCSGCTAYKEELREAREKLKAVGTWKGLNDKDEWADAIDWATLDRILKGGM